MKRFVSVMIITVLAANPVMACVELRERPFTDSDHDRLALHLDENVAEVSSATPIRELSSRGFDCGPLETQHSISFDDPDDYVQVDSALPNQIGRNIVASIRDSMLVDAAGHYKFREWDEEKISDTALDLLRIESADIGLYKVYANSDASCAYHIIELREVEFGLESCSFEILKNEVVHFL